MSNHNVIKTYNEYSPEFSREYEELGLCREDSTRFPSVAKAHNGYKIPVSMIADALDFWNPETIDEDRVAIEELDLVSAVFCGGYRIDIWPGAMPRDYEVGEEH